MTTSTFSFSDMIAAANSATASKPVVSKLDVPTIQQGLTFDALAYIAKGESSSDQRAFNSEVANAIFNKGDVVFCDTDGDNKIPAAFMQMLGAAVQRVGAARQSEEGESEAVQALEYLLNFTSALCASVTRGAYFMHRAALTAEEAGADRAYAIRSEYNGFSGQLKAEPADVQAAAEGLVDELLKVHGSLSKMCSPWFQTNRVFNCGGYSQDGKFVNFLSVAEAWKHFEDSRPAFVKLAGSEAAKRLVK